MQLVSGVSTSGVILSTVRWLADADFNITVIRDCCADRDHDVHTMLCNKVPTLSCDRKDTPVRPGSFSYNVHRAFGMQVFPRQATVLNVDQVIVATLCDVDPSSNRRN
jgi:hypothetical protein